MNIDHICIAVKDIHKSIIYWKEVFGYQQMTEVVLNTRQKVHVVFLEKSGSLTVKLIEPSEESSPLVNFTKKGGGLHHICFKTHDLQESVADLKSKGMIALNKPEPGEAFDNELIAFLFGKDNINIELIDTDKKASRITKF